MTVVLKILSRFEHEVVADAAQNCTCSDEHICTKLIPKSSILNKIICQNRHFVKTLNFSVQFDERAISYKSNVLYYYNMHNSIAHLVISVKLRPYSWC